MPKIQSGPSPDRWRLADKIRRHVEGDVGDVGVGVDGVVDRHGDIDHRAGTVSLLLVGVVLNVGCGNAGADRRVVVAAVLPALPRTA
jgi:hypothetical protein